MPTTPSYFRVRIRNADDDADALVISSYPGDANPYIIDPPSGDGESVDPISGKPTTGAYSIHIADEVKGTNNRVLTAQLADVYARQQLLARKAWVEKSANGTTWATLVVGYITALRLIDAITFEIAVGQSRRIENSRTVFKEASGLFANMTTVIGGPVLDDFADMLLDHGGWTMKIAAIFTTPDYLRLALQTNGGFDPRKSPTTTFSTLSTAIADYTNDWARPFYEPNPIGDDIQGHFPGVRIRLVPITNPGADVLLVPLSVPQALNGPWWEDIGVDNITSSGTSPLYLPAEDANGDPFAPALDDEFEVYLYALAVSDANPLHYYGHPVDLWEDLRIDAGIEYDATVLPALRALIGESRRVALRPTQSYKLADVDAQVIYGPFRLSSRIEDGEEVLISIAPSDTPPTTTITIDDLRSDQGTVFDLDESTVVTAIRLKTQRLIKWSTDESDQPESDSLIARDAYPQAIENSDDDIPEGAENEQSVGDIPGMIMVDGSGPISLTNFLTQHGAEMFDRFGRGAITVELHCLPTVTTKVGEEVLLDLPHLPGAVVGESPVSQRGIAPLPFQVIQRTETAEGPDLKLVNSVSSELADGVLPTFTLAASTIDDVRYGEVIITNADDLNAAELNCRCDYAVGAIEPASGSGTHFTTILAEFMTSPTFAFFVGPVEEGATLWVQLRAESPGLRPGDYTAWQSQVLTPP